ncbi:hypothetical protein BKA56DRAFT_601504 [Ilyonectria sp. MPI-CAGE-AT-0026]|nr:hypothetical protein BKA56DRAFT_601504 [Ilyonectria sp. MPI-CAGE-AT-0026]
MDFRSPFTWYTVHLMCILSHSALFLAGSAGIAIGIEYDVVFSSGVAGLMGMFATIVNGIYLAMYSPLTERTTATTDKAFDESTDEATDEATEQVPDQATVEIRRFKSKLGLAIFTLFNCTFTIGSDFTFAGITGVRAHEQESITLVVLCVIAVIAGITVLLANVVDVLRIYYLFTEKEQEYFELKDIEVHV